MEVIEKTEKYIVSVDGEKVSKGNVCVFWAKGVCCLGMFDSFGKRGAIEFVDPFSGKRYSLMPHGISSLIILNDAEVLLRKE